MPRYIAVEGPIGVGKTTLAQRISDALRYPLLLEPVTENPFLDRFYKDGHNSIIDLRILIGQFLGQYFNARVKWRHII